MQESNPGNPDLLHRAGESLLQFDTRWVVVVALVLFVLIYFVKWKRKNAMPQTESVRLALALLQVYTGLAVLSVFILTQPPAIALMSNYQRQTCGLIVMVFLIVGVFQEAKKFWDG